MRCLSDAEKRQQYDQFGHAAFDGGAGGGGAADSISTAWIWETFLEIFSEISLVVVPEEEQMMVL